MTVASEITKLQTNLTNSYSACEEKGATLPIKKNFDNLPATIESITTGGGGAGETKYGCTANTFLGDVNSSGALSYGGDSVGDIVFTGVKSVPIQGLAYKFLRNDKLTHGISFPDLVSLTTANSCNSICDLANVTFADFPKLTQITGNNTFQYAFRQCPNLASINFPKLTTLKATNIFNYTFQRCTKLTSVEFPELTTINGGSLMYYTFEGCTGITSVNFPKLTTITGNNALYYAFYDCRGMKTVSFPALQTISSQYACSSAFRNCKSLEDIEFPALTKIDGNSCCINFFSDCTSLATASFPELTTINGTEGASQMLINCSNLTSVNLSKLKTISGTSGAQLILSNCKKLETVELPALSEIKVSYALRYAFRYDTNIKDIYFNSLTTESFGSYTNQFSDMMAGTETTTTHTLHFPSNLESKISTLTGYPLFGGTSGYVILAFDLQATS